MSLESWHFQVLSLSLGVFLQITDSLIPSLFPHVQIERIGLMVSDKDT